MAIQDCNDIIQSYLRFMTEGFEVSEADNICQISTPYWRPDGDHIDIYAYQVGDLITLTDQGETYDWLFSVGLEIEGNDTREEIVNRLIQRYGIVVHRGALTLQVPITELGQAMHRYISTISNISQITLLRKQRGKATFKEEVALYLLEQGQDFQSDYRVKGRTMEHKVDFYLNSTRNMLVKAVSANNISSATNAAIKVSFEWFDIGGIDANSYSKVTVIDDISDTAETLWSREKVRNPIETYSDRVVLWSQRVRLLAPLEK